MKIGKILSNPSEGTTTQHTKLIRVSAKNCNNLPKKFIKNVN